MITRKSMLYQSKVGYGEWALSHILGCTHGCRYCYAFKNAKRWGRVKDYADWCNPKIVVNTLELLEKEIPRYRDKIGNQTVHISFMTDPFMMMHPEVHELSLACIRLLNSHGIRCRILTKGDLLPLVCHGKYDDLFGKGNEWGITLVSLDWDFQMKFEPMALNPDSRLYGLNAFRHDGGAKDEFLWASMEPYPTPNIVKQDLWEILEKLHFVDRIVFGKWNYSKLTEGWDLWYVGQARKVKLFCLNRKIACYVKKEIKLT